jgi:hypothetical protein
VLGILAKVKLQDEKTPLLETAHEYREAGVGVLRITPYSSAASRAERQRQRHAPDATSGVHGEILARSRTAPPLSAARRQEAAVKRASCPVRYQTTQQAPETRLPSKYGFPEQKATGVALL